MTSYYGYWTSDDPLQQAIYSLQAELSGLFQVTAVIPQKRSQIISFVGRLLGDSDGSYDEIQRRFQAYGYTPMLRHQDGEDVVVALPSVAEESGTGNPLVNILLFLATVATTLSAGAAMAGANVLDALATGNLAIILDTLWAGIPFAGTLLLILGVHELGHYVAARWHRVQATLPYFIPMPVGGLGTLGAFIALRSPMKDRKVLFDIGLAGPIAGFLVALPLLLAGLALSPVVPGRAGGLTLDALGPSVLTNLVVQLFANVPAGSTLALSPVFFAAWLGLLLTGINLLPIGQLDGGHVAYALFGRRAHTLAQVAFGILLLAGLFVSTNWLIWALFLSFGGLRHPAPLNDLAELGPARRLLGYLSIVLFFLVLVPTPFR